MYADGQMFTHSFQMLEKHNDKIIAHSDRR